MLRPIQEIDYKDVFKIHSQGQERSRFRGTVGWLLPPFLRSLLKSAFLVSKMSFGTYHRACYQRW